MRTWKVTFGIEDANRDTAYLMFWLSSGRPDEQIDELGSPYHFAQELAAFIAPLIKGVIVFIHLFENVPLPTNIPVGAMATADVQERARWKWRTSEGNITQFLMPTIDETLMIYNSDGVSIDITQPDVAAFIAIMTLPIEQPYEWTIAVCDSRGEDITDFIEAKEYFG